MDLQQLKQQLAAEYGKRIELHAHTSPVSKCSDISPREMVEIYSALGYDALVVTNHFQWKEERDPEEYLDLYITDYEELVRYGKERGLKIYLGAEIRFTENSNDYLIYGVDREMLREIYDLLPLGFEHFRKNYKMERSLFVQAHPLRDKMERVDISLLDGIEAYNLHPGHNSRVGQAAILARKNTKIITVGTDFHHTNRDHEGLGALRVKSLPEDSFALAALLRSEDYLFELGGGDLLLH